MTRERMVSLAGIAGASGITGRGIGRLLDACAPRFECNSPISRLRFLKATAAAAAAGTLGCESSPTSPPGLDPDQTAEFVRAIITGPSELGLPALGASVSAEFDSRASTPPSLMRYWKVWKDVDPFGEGERNLGNFMTVSTDLTRPGGYTVKLRVTNSGNESTAIHQVSVLPPPSPGQDFPLVAFGRDVDDGSASVRSDLYLLNPVSRATTRIGGGPGFRFWGQALAWEKGGERLATEAGLGGPSVFVYDLLKDEITRVSTPGAPFSWTAAWNPQKDWIAYAERHRGYTTEAVLVRPDGSERIFVNGDTFKRGFAAGRYPTWSPDGEHLALGWTEYVGLTEALEMYGVPDRRISVFTGLWSGSPTRIQIPTEDQLMAFLDSLGENNLSNRIALDPCVNGMSWSPDGEWLAYTLRFGFIDQGGSTEYLLKSRTDGTGDIEILVPGENAPNSVTYYFGKPTWSPQGQTLLFAAGDLGAKGIKRVSARGGSFTDLTSGFADYSPGWYQ